MRRSVESVSKMGPVEMVDSRIPSTKIGKLLDVLTAATWYHGPARATVALWTPPQLLMPGLAPMQNQKSGVQDSLGDELPHDQYADGPPPPLSVQVRGV